MRGTILQRTLMAFALVLVIQAGTAHAVSKTVDSAPPQEVVDGMSTKAVRGLANITTGWLEFPKQIYVTAQEDGAAKAIFVGPVKGIGMTLVRTLAGVGEFATFFLAYPGFYDPYFDPPYVWQKE
jgi:putative exosortase-associated protein (TIGR04073 family)